MKKYTKVGIFLMTFSVIGIIVAAVALILAPHSHMYTKWQVVQKMTCTQNEVQQRVCRTCDFVETKEAKAPGHQFGEWKTQAGKTCDKVRSCHCGEEEFKVEHTFGKPKVTKAATCTTEGTQESVCVCNEKKVETIKPTGHKQDTKWTTDYESTCVTQGEKYKACINCKKPMVYEYLPLADHDYTGEWIDGPEGEGYQYKSCATEGCPVKQLAIQSVGLNVKYSGKSSTIMGVTDSFIANDLYLTSKGNKEGEITNIANLAFEGLQFTSATIGEGYTTIGNDAFSNCSKMRILVLPSTLKSIGAWAFSNCTDLEIILYAGTLKEWESITKNINWDTNIGSYLLINSKDGTILKASDNYNRTDVTIPGCTPNGIAIKEIPSKLFSGKAIESVTILDGIETIGTSAFSQCTSLTKVVIPASVTKIDASAFYGCTNLKTIDFEGTEAQWNAITKGFAWNMASGIESINFLK